MYPKMCGPLRSNEFRWPGSFYLREAVSSSENPLLVDDRTTAKMKSVVHLNAHLNSENKDQIWSFEIVKLIMDKQIIM